MTGDDLSAIEPWLSDVAEALAPAGRKRLATKIGQALRKLNSLRIAANVQPDGSKMAPRRPREGRIKAKVRGKMFKRLRMIKNFKLRASPDGVILHFGRAGRVAAEHHYGLEAVVGKSRAGNAIRTRYAARRLIGFGREDRRIVSDAAIDHLAK